MSKIFAGELIGEELALGLGLAPETAGLSIPLTFASIGVVAMVHAIKHKKQEKANSKREDEERQRKEEADRQEQERQEQMLRAQEFRKKKEERKQQEEAKQRELEQIAQQQERDRLAAEEAARVAEQQRIEAEQLAQQQAQEQAEAQRRQEDQDYQNQMQVRNQAIEDQLLVDRQNRMGSRLVNVYGYRYENVNPIVNALFPANVGTEEDQKEEWALISGNQFDPARQLPYLDPYRPRANFDDPNLPYPDGDADDHIEPDFPNGGGGGGPAGGGGGGGNGGGGGYPNNDPAGNNYNQQGQPNRQGGGNYFVGNPFGDIIKQISDKIAQNRERERPPPNPEVDQQPDNPQSDILGKDGHGQWIYDPNRPENQKPQSGDMPGKNGSGTYNPQNPYITKQNDDVNLVENELLAIINNQGLSELNQEDMVVNTRQTINELQRLEYQVSNLLPPQAMVGASSVFTSAISRF